MKTGRCVCASLIVLLAAGLMTGCGPDSKDFQIQKLQEDNDRLASERADLEARLAAAQNDAQGARSRAVELQAMLDDARRQLESRPTSISQPIANLPAGWVGNENIAWTDIAEDILFDSGQAKLKGTGRNKLQEVARQIQTNYPDREIWVIGHTDNDPIKRTAKMWDDNLDLSANRGMTVVRELAKLGIAQNRLVAAGQGEFKPKVENTSKSNKAQNRRVQIVAVRVPPMGGGYTNDGGMTGGGSTMMDTTTGTTRG